MRLVFLGTAAGVPSPKRNVSGLALQFENRREWWLFDCGEGTQHQIMRSELSISQVRRIFLSHLHGDHCFGLPGLMASRGLSGGAGRLDVYGPPGTREYLECVRRTTHTHFAYEHEVHEITAPGVIAEDEEYVAHARHVLHVGPTLAFVIIEKPRPGRFRVEQAQALGIPPGPVYARLKQGEAVRLDDGRVIAGADLVEPPRQGRKAVIVCDTSDASAVLDIGQDADVMVHEATFLEAGSDPAALAAFGHSTAAEAGRLAQKANAQRLLLNHFSHRYEPGGDDAPQIGDLVAEAEREFVRGRVTAAEDFMRVEVPAKAGGSGS